MKREDLEAAVEAILLIATEPVTVDNLLRAFQGQATPSEIVEILKDIEKRYNEQSRGIILRKAAGGYQFVTRGEVSVFVRNFLKETNIKKLSKAAIEVLAIIAYRQPITAPEISAIRGTESNQVIKGLLEKKFIKISGRKQVVGKPLLYSTTKEFLVHFGLNSLDDLPNFEEIEDVFNENLKQESLFKDLKENRDYETTTIQ